MNSEEETLITAYLDGELDAARRNGVEATLREGPRAARVLSDRAAARDLVAGLPRPPAPDDLAARVLDRIATGRRPALSIFSLGRGASAAALATAAGALLAISFLLGPAFNRLPFGRRPAPAGLANSAPASAPSSPAGAAPRRILPEIVAATPAVRTGEPANDDRVASTADKGPAPRPSGDPGRRADNDEYRRMFDGSHPVRRLALDVDLTDADKLREVERIITTTWPMNGPRPTVRVARGTVLDTTHGGAARVFVVLMTPDQGRRLTERLRAAFGPVTADRLTPDALAMVAEPGRVVFHEGPHVAPLNPGDPPHPVRPIDAIRTPRETTTPAVPRPKAERAETGPPPPATAVEEGGTVTVVVWLTSPPADSGAKK